jgi:hypothetical protein
MKGGPACRGGRSAPDEHRREFVALAKKARALAAPLGA